MNQINRFNLKKPKSISNNNIQSNIPNNNVRRKVENVNS